MRSQSWLVSLALVLAGCLGEGGGDERERTAVPVEIVAASVADLDVVVQAVGGIEAREGIELRAERPGRVERLLGKEGQRVEAGIPLVELDARAAEAEVALARASVADAEARSRNAQRGFERMRALSGEGIASEQSRDDAAADKEQAAASLEVARARLVVAEAVLEDTTIEAPFSGWLGRWTVDPGAFVQAGEILNRLANDNPLEIVFSVPERSVAALAAGQQMNLRVASHPGEIFSGEVRFVDPQVDPLTRTATVVGQLPNPERDLRPGQFARIELVLEKRRGVTVVPEEAVRRIGESYFVFVVTGSEAIAREVEIGPRRGHDIQIVRGLQRGEAVVRNGHGRMGVSEAESIRVVTLEDDRE